MKSSPNLSRKPGTSHDEQRPSFLLPWQRESQSCLLFQASSSLPMRQGNGYSHMNIIEAAVGQRAFDLGRAHYHCLFRLLAGAAVLVLLQRLKKGDQRKQLPVEGAMKPNFGNLHSMPHEHQVASMTMASRLQLN